jgi:hypothetical protein
MDMEQREELPTPILESVTPAEADLHVPTQIVVRGLNFIAELTSVCLGERLLESEVISPSEMRATVLSDTQGNTVLRGRSGYKSGNELPFKVGNPVPGNPVRGGKL